MTEPEKRTVQSVIDERRAARERREGLTAAMAKLGVDPETRRKALKRFREDEQ